MSDTTNGPARALVERAILNAARPIHEILPALRELDSTRDEASAHDAAFAALVQAAQTTLALLDNGTEDDWYEQGVSVTAQLRAALDAVQKEGDNG